MPQIPKVTVKSGYRPQSKDTSIEAEVLLFNLLRQLSPINKAQRIQKLDQTIRQLSSLKKVIEDPISLALKIAGILEQLQIIYYLGDSLASSIWGEPRYSEDLDLVIALSLEQKPKLIKSFETEFYISETAIEDAINGHCISFNIISLISAEKADIFIARKDAFSQSQLTRRVSHSVPGGTLWISSPEDTILQKLLWRKQSRSEKQWRDILGILKVQKGTLDHPYLSHWALQLAVAEDLTEAIEQATP